MISYLYFSNVSSAVIIDSYLQIFPGLYLFDIMQSQLIFRSYFRFRISEEVMKKSLVICLFKICFFEEFWSAAFQLLEEFWKFFVLQICWLFIVKYFPCTSSVLWAFNYCPNTADKWYFRLYFWKKKSYHTDCSSYTSTNVKIFLHIQLFLVFLNIQLFVVIPLHIFALCFRLLANQL